MKVNLSDQKNAAITASDVLVVIVCLFILAVLLLPMFAAAKRSGGPVHCVCYLSQIGLAFRIWAEDNDDQFPTTVSVTNGGAMELVEAGNVAGCFQLVSNVMTTPKILVCPNDTSRTFATNWDELNGSHISYFLSPDPSNGDNGNMVLSGDDNLAINGMPAKSGLVDLASNNLIEWAAGHHSTVYKPHFWSSPKIHGCGNLLFADGSVQQESPNGLQLAFQRTGSATNRIVIP